MSTEYRTMNTSVSGSALLASLSGNDVRALEFEAANKQPHSKLIGQAEVASLDVDEWMQASIGTLMLQVDSTAPVALNLGPDSSEQASLYLSLFNMHSDDAERLLHFGLAGATGADVNLQNATGPGTYVQVNVQGVTGPSGVEALFVAANAAGTNCAGDGAGLERLVILKPLSRTPGLEAVQFNILPKSV